MSDTCTNNGQGWPLGQPPKECVKYLTTCLAQKDLLGVYNARPYPGTACPVGTSHFMVSK